MSERETKVHTFQDGSSNLRFRRKSKRYPCLFVPRRKMGQTKQCEKSSCTAKNYGLKFVSVFVQYVCACASICLCPSIHNISGKYGHFWIWEDFSSSLGGNFRGALPLPSFLRSDSRKQTFGRRGMSHVVKEDRNY